MTTLTPTRTRLRERIAAAAVRPAYTYRWQSTPDGWRLVVTVAATGQEIPTTFNVRKCPGDLAGERIARRLFEMRKEARP